MDHKEEIENMYKELRVLNYRGSLCAFTILIKDLAEYLNIHALSSEADTLFLNAYNCSLDYHRGYWSAEGFGGKIFDPIAMTGWPFGYAKRAVAGNYDLSKLVDAAANDLCTDPEPPYDATSEKKTASVTDCKYYAYLGWDVLRRLEPELGPIVYDIDNPSIDVVAAANKLVAQKLKKDTYWYAFAVFYSLIYLHDKEPV